MKTTLVDSDLKSCVENQIIIPQNNLKINNLIQPSSIDIPLGTVAYLLPHRALSPKTSIDEMAPEIALKSFNLNEDTLMLKHHTYLVETDIEIDLVDNLTAKCSPKSSIGRIDVLVRCVCSNVGMYDSFPKKTKGKLWLEITPQSFNIIVREGICMSQIRLFDDSTEPRSLQECQELLQSCIKSESKILEDEDIAFLGLEINSEKSFGYVARRTQKPINLSRRDQNPNDYFEEIKAYVDDFGNSYVTIEKDKFYIFHTKEKLSVPITHSIEMLPYSHLIGDFRAHYAGFFDPGFGGENGAIGVLEVRSYEDIVIFDSQPICAIIAYKNSKIPNHSYGELGNNYQGQEGPRLSKFFK